MKEDQYTQAALRDVIGNAEMDFVLTERERVAESIKEIVDAETSGWGVDLESIKIQEIELPAEMKRAMARQAEAERERRAKVINAAGELQASKKLAQAAGIMSREPASISLRFLQTVTEIAAENNSTTLFPIPIDLFRPMIEKAAKAVDSLTGDMDDEDLDDDEATPSLPGSRMELGAGEEREAAPARRRGGAALDAEEQPDPDAR